MDDNQFHTSFWCPDLDLSIRESFSMFFLYASSKFHRNALTSSSFLRTTHKINGWSSEATNCWLMLAHLPVIRPGQNTHTHSAKSSWNIFHCSGAHPQSQVLHQGPTSWGHKAGPCYESLAVEQVDNGITTKARDQTTKLHSVKSLDVAFARKQFLGFLGQNCSSCTICTHAQHNYVMSEEVPTSLLSVKSSHQTVALLLHGDERHSTAWIGLLQSIQIVTCHQQDTHGTSNTIQRLRKAADMD